MDDKKPINLNDIKPGDTNPDKSGKSKHGKSNKPEVIFNEKREAWESGIKVLDKVDVIISAKLLFICDKVASMVHNDEFSIVTKIKEKDDATLILSEEYYIPKQKVANTSIEYLPDQYSFNTVIHRHPNGMNNFSSTDRNYINQNFELSILYTREDGFVNGVYNLKLEHYLVQIPVEIYIDYGLEEIDISNIERETFLSTFNRGKSDKWHNKRDSGFDIFSDSLGKSESKLFPEESFDYSMMREMMLDEINSEIQNLEHRVTNIEDSMFHGSYSLVPGEGPF
ncbi:MAG: hypothetical protein ACOYN6_01840 [Ignavibacteria bacterium]